jgi:hypothetical protein
MAQIKQINESDLVMAEERFIAKGRACHRWQIIRRAKYLGMASAMRGMLVTYFGHPHKRLDL